MVVAQFAPVSGGVFFLIFLLGGLLFIALPIWLLIGVVSAVTARARGEDKVGRRILLGPLGATGFSGHQGFLLYLVAVVLFLWLLSDRFL